MKSSRMRAKTDNAKTATKLLVALTGKASRAKAAEGDEPVFAYIASLPQPQRGGGVVTGPGTEAVAEPNRLARPDR